LHFEQQPLIFDVYEEIIEFFDYNTLQN